MARFANPYTPRTEIGAGLQNLMGALYAQKLNAGDGDSAAKRSAAQDERDRAEARKARLEADTLERTERGITDLVTNLAKSLVPENEVPLVTERNKTGIWPAFEDARRQQSVMEGVGPVDWNDEKEGRLTDAKRNQALLAATKQADFKDLSAATEGPADARELSAMIAQGFGLPSRNAPVTVNPARADVPQLGLPRGRGMLTQVEDENGVITKPYDVSQPSAIPLDPSAPPDIQMPMVNVEAAPEVAPPQQYNWDRLIDQLPMIAAKNPAAANAINSAAGERRQRDENARKAGKTRTSLGTSGLEYDDKLNKFFIAGSDTPATAEQLAAFEKSGKSPGVVVNAFEKKQRDKDTGTDVVLRRKEAMRAIDFAAAGRAAAQALEGYSGGPFAQWQAKLGNVLPESKWGKIASVEELAKGLRGKMVQELRAEGSGATSDLEFGEFMSAFPTLAQTPQGRALISQGFEKYAERVAAAADIYAELVDSGKFSLTSYRKAIKERLGDNLFTREEMAAIRSGGERRAGPVFDPKASTTPARKLTPEQVEAARIEAQRRGIR